MNTFSILESYKAGWRGFKQNWLYILGAMLTLGLISSLADIYMFIKTGTLNFATGPIYSLFSLIISLVTMVLSYNFISGTLDASENKKVKIANLFNFNRVSIKGAGRYLLIGLALGVMCLVFVAPLVVYSADSTTFFVDGRVEKELYLLFALAFVGVLYVYSLFGFSVIAMVNENKTAIQALKYSYKISHPHAFKIMAFYIMTGLLMLLGFIAFVLPGIILTAIFYFSSIWIYKKIKD